MEKEQMYKKVQTLRSDYKNALFQIPEYVEACAEAVFEAPSKDTIQFEANGVGVEVRINNTHTSNMLSIETITNDFHTSVLLYSNTSPLNGGSSKNGMFEIEKTALRPMRKNSFGNKELSIKGPEAVKPIRRHIKEVLWIALQDFAVK